MLSLALVPVHAQSSSLFNLHFDDLNGVEQSLATYQGKPMVVNFWATWCPPCRAEMPSMETLWNKNKNNNFVILAVSVDREKTSKVADFIKTNKYTFQIFHDTNGKLAQMFLINNKKHSVAFFIRDSV